VSVGRDPVTKRYRYVSRSFSGTKKQAEAALAVLLTEVNAGAGGHKGTDAATLGDLVEQWLDLRKESLSVTTWDAYAGKARFRLIPALGDMQVRRLAVRDIDAFYRSLARDHDLAPSTIRQIHNVLKGSLDQAVRWGWRTDNPARLATLPPQRQADVRPPSPVEVLHVIQAADQEFATFLRIAAAVGSRRGEVSALRWSAVDLDAGELKIVRAIVEDADGKLHEKDTKTHQARRIALDDGTVAALRHWRRTLEERAAACGATLPAEGFVFSPDVDGARPWRPYRWTSAWRKVRDKAGIDKAVRLHDLRHFAATHLLDAGVPVKTVSGRLGHARPATTLNVYAQFIPSTDRTAADVMGRILTSIEIEHPVDPSVEFNG
jgi:integrase